MENNKLPHHLRNSGREIYFKMFSHAGEKIGLQVDRLSCPEAVLKIVIIPSKKIWGFTVKKELSEVIAIIKSDSTVGAPDDLSNEFICGVNTRKYDGLEIYIVNKKYQEIIEDFILLLKAILKENIVLK